MQRLYVATGDAFARVEQDRGGWRVWTALPATGAQCVAFAPASPETVFVGTRGRGLWRSHDAGETWEDTALPQADVFYVYLINVYGVV